jgi:hypothetical protein
MALEAGESVYRGTRHEVAWSPDVLLEFQASTAAPSGFERGYAVVVDAKYSRRIAPEILREASKYLGIRSCAFGHKVVRQVWLAHPDQTPLELEDDAVEWTADGPSAPPTEEMLGKIGLMPVEGATRIREATAAAGDFVSALLRYVGIEEGMDGIKIEFLDDVAGRPSWPRRIFGLISCPSANWHGGTAIYIRVTGRRSEARRLRGSEIKGGAALEAPFSRRRSIVEVADVLGLRAVGA